MTISEKAREELDQIIADTIDAYYASEENRKVLQEDLYPDIRDEVLEEIQEKVWSQIEQELETAEKVIKEDAINEMHSEVDPEIASCNNLIEANQDFITRIDEELLKLSTKYNTLKNRFQSFVMIVVVFFLAALVIVIR